MKLSMLYSLQVSFPQFNDVIGRIALIAFGKYPHCNKHKTAIQRCEAFIIYLDMCEGRRKAGLKSDPWVSMQLEKQGLQKKAAGHKGR